MYKVLISIRYFSFIIIVVCYRLIDSIIPLFYLFAANHIRMAMTTFSLGNGFPTKCCVDRLNPQPKAATQVANTSVSFGENRRSDWIFQRLLTTQLRHLELKHQGLFGTQSSISILVSSVSELRHVTCLQIKVLLV